MPIGLTYNAGFMPGLNGTQRQLLLDFPDSFNSDAPFFGFKQMQHAGNHGIQQDRLYICRHGRRFHPSAQARNHNRRAPPLSCGLGHGATSRVHGSLSAGPN